MGSSSRRSGIRVAPPAATVLHKMEPTFGRPRWCCWIPPASSHRSLSAASLTPPQMEEKTFDRRMP